MTLLRTYTKQDCWWSL